MIADARDRIRQTRAESLFGAALGAIAGGDPDTAGTILASYEKEPAAQSVNTAALRNAIAAIRPSPPDAIDERTLREYIPGLDRAAFVATLKRAFAARTGTEPAAVELAASGVEIADQRAAEGVKTQIDRYAAALAEMRLADERQVRMRGDRDSQGRPRRGSAPAGPLRALFQKPASRATLG